jgi:hypothetical protein
VVVCIWSAPDAPFSGVGSVRLAGLVIACLVIGLIEENKTEKSFSNLAGGLPSNWTKRGRRRRITTTTKWSLEPVEYAAKNQIKFFCEILKYIDINILKMMKSNEASINKNTSFRDEFNDCIKEDIVDTRRVIKWT